FNFIPFFHWVYKQAFIQSTGHNKLTTKLFTELSRHNHTSFYIDCMLVFSHKHFLVPTFMVLCYHIPPLYTTLIHKFFKEKSITNPLGTSVPIYSYVSPLLDFHIKKPLTGSAPINGLFIII